MQKVNGQLITLVMGQVKRAPKGEAIEFKSLKSAPHYFEEIIPKQFFRCPIKSRASLSPRRFRSTKKKSNQRLPPPSSTQKMIWSLSTGTARSFSTPKEILPGQSSFSSLQMTRSGGLG